LATIAPTDGDSNNDIGEALRVNIRPETVAITTYTVIKMIDMSQIANVDVYGPQRRASVPGSDMSDSGIPETSQRYGPCGWKAAGWKEERAATGVPRS